MVNIKLSIIIPVFNKGKYLSNCLSSILRQKFSDYEIIVINDGSTDDSEKIAKSFEEIDQRIKVFTFVNSGASAARNHGLSIAKGKFILFIDADDWIENDYLEKIMIQVEEHEADIYIWGITKDFTNKREIISPDLEGLLSKQDFLYSFVREQYEKKKGLYGYVSNKLLKNKILNDRGIRFNESLRMQEDYDFFLSYFDQIRYVFLFKESGYHYVAGTDYSSGAMVKNVDYIALIDIQLKCRKLLLNNNCLDENNQKILMDVVQNLSIASFLEMNPVSIENIRVIINALIKKSLHSRGLNLKQNSLICFLIRKKQIYLIFLYLIIWKTYLFIRKII